MSTEQTQLRPPRHGHRLRQALVDGPNSLGARARARRWHSFLHHFPELGQMRVLDLGGTVEWWRRAPMMGAQVTVLNLLEPGESTDPRLVPVLGDACAAEATLLAAGVDTRFDLVFSNSLLEHVGGHARRADLAEQVHRLAPHHWVQTPNRYFPIEPHWVFPGMQFLPVRSKAWIAQHWPLTHTRPGSYERALASVQWTELVGPEEMRSYFPGSTLLRERVAGLPKSLIAVR